VSGCTISGDHSHNSGSHHGSRHGSRHH
jgi:hypothetical protein